MNRLALPAAVEELLLDGASLRERLDASDRDHRRAFDVLLREIVEIADGVERLRSSAAPEAAAHLGTVLQQVEELLGGHDVSVYRPSVGDPVDGLVCDVMATVTSPNLRPGTVTRVLRAGYRQGERVVRRAGVEVVKE